MQPALEPEGRVPVEVVLGPGQEQEVVEPALEPAQEREVVELGPAQEQAAVEEPALGVGAQVAPVWVAQEQQASGVVGKLLPL